jgi:hypothetical protein
VASPACFCCWWNGSSTLFHFWPNQSGGPPLLRASIKAHTSMEEKLHVLVHFEYLTLLTKQRAIRKYTYRSPLSGFAHSIDHCEADRDDGNSSMFVGRSLCRHLCPCLWRAKSGSKRVTNENDFSTVRPITTEAFLWSFGGCTRLAHSHVRRSRKSREGKV